VRYTQSPRDIIYPQTMATICADLQPDQVRGGQLLAPPLTAAKAMELLGWESEADYAVRRRQGYDQHRKGAGSPSYTKDGEEECPSPYLDDYAIRDIKGVKVRCHHLASSKLSRYRAMGLAHQLLTATYPHVGGRCVSVSRTGLVTNGGVLLAALVLADQAWHTAVMPDDRGVPTQEYAAVPGFGLVYPARRPVLGVIIILGVTDPPGTVIRPVEGNITPTIIAK
jgi:hypothetical protein